MARSKTYNIVVSYSLAKNGAAVFDDVAAGSTRARRKIEQDAAAAGKAVEASLGKGGKAGSDALGKGFDDAVSKARKASKEIETIFARGAAEEAKAADRAAQAKVRAEQRVFDEKLRLSQRAARERERAAEREYQQIVRDVEREEKAKERAAERSAKAQERAAKRASQDRRGFYSDVASRTMSTSGAMASSAFSTARSTAEAFGARFSLTDAVGNAVVNEGKAQSIINQVKMAGKSAPEGGAKGLVGYASAVGDATAGSAGDILDALGEFQAKSNDLKTGQAVMVDLGKLAKAAGANFKDVAAGAAFVNAQLDNTPDKGEKLLAIMRAITMQTAAGQIELEHWAKYIPRIAAAANAFSGDYETNIATLSAIAQMSVKGGRATAAEASGSAAALSRDMRKGQTMKAWNKFEEGWSVFTDSSHTKMKPPEQIYMEAVEKTKGDQAKLVKLFPNVVSAAPAFVLSDIYNRARGKGEDGMAAVRAEFAQYKVALSKQQVDEYSGDVLSGKQSSAQRFNNALDRIGADVAERVAPKLEAMAPAALRAAEAMANFGLWAAEHPKTAIMAAIGAAFAKETIGAALRNAISGQGPGSGGSLGKAAGGLAAAGMVLSVATATFTITSAVISVLADATDKGITKSQDRDSAVMNIMSEARKAAEDGNAATIDSVAARLATEIEMQKERIERAKASSGVVGATASFFSATSGELFGGAGFDVRSASRSDADRMPQLEKDLQAMTEKLEAMKSGVQKVHVVNPQTNPLMSSPDGREGISDHGG